MADVGQDAVIGSIASYQTSAACGRLMVVTVVRTARARERDAPTDAVRVSEAEFSALE